MSARTVRGKAVAALLLTCMGPVPALADTIEAALVRAYQNNPRLNAEPASVRSTDENVPQALSGCWPKVAVTASAGYQYIDANSTFGGTATQIVRSEVRSTLQSERPPPRLPKVKRPPRKNGREPMIPAFLPIREPPARKWKMHCSKSLA